MKRIAVLALVVLMALVEVSCTSQQRAKEWGGTAKVELPAGQKLVVATWKDENLWYLMRPGEQPETYEFIESSSFGIMNGKVIFVESNK